MIVPTGIGAEIGGHSGDATSAAHLLAACCDTLITHPNVLNASDLSSIPENCLYVEGSMIDDLLGAKIGLATVSRSNRILVACNEVDALTVNAINAARSIHGVEAGIVVLGRPLTMIGHVTDGVADGTIVGSEAFIEQMKPLRYDALAVHTEVRVDDDTVNQYMAYGGVNPWGGVEARFSRLATRTLGKPVAHAPMEAAPADFGVSDPRLSPEMICGSHLVSVLAGLRRAPRACDPRFGITAEDVDVLVSPMCWGEPHRLARGLDIPVILVYGNTTTQSDAAVEAEGDDGVILVRNYLEAAGVLTMMRLGRSLESVNRPLEGVEVTV